MNYESTINRNPGVIKGSLLPTIALLVAIIGIIMLWVIIKLRIKK